MDSSQEGIVIVSMSNLFHIFDKERTAEIKKPKPNPNLNKAITVASKKGNKNYFEVPSKTLRKLHNI